MDRKIALTVAGSDPSGGAGLQQDVRVFSALGLYSGAVVTALTVQNTQGVKYVKPVDAQVVKDQFETVIEDFLPDCIKLGMLATSENVRAVCEVLKKIPEIPVVADPVMLSTNGKELLEKDAREIYINELLPLVDVLTPNLNEAETMTGIEVKSVSAMKEAAFCLLKKMENNRSSSLKPCVLVKGGHLPDDHDAVDVVVSSQGVQFLTSVRADSTDTHGTGCTLASAICGFICLGCDFDLAIDKGKKFVTEAIKAGLRIGKGRGPVDPLVFVF